MTECRAAGMAIFGAGSLGRGSPLNVSHPRPLLIALAIDRSPATDCPSICIQQKLTSEAGLVYRLSLECFLDCNNMLEAPKSPRCREVVSLAASVIHLLQSYRTKPD